MIYTEDSIKILENALENLVKEDNYLWEDFFHHENNSAIRYHVEIKDVVNYVGYYLYDEHGKYIISCNNWLNLTIQQDIYEIASPDTDISITNVLLNFLDSTKNVNCVHFCSDGYIHIETEKNEDISISVEDFIREYLVFDSIEEREKKLHNIQEVFNYHISILKHINTKDNNSINPESHYYRAVLKEKKINKYFSFFPIYYYTSNSKRVFFVLTILQSDYLCPSDAYFGDCVLNSYRPIIGTKKVKKVQYFLQSALWLLLQDRLSYEKRKGLYESLKSAKAAIMSRNMSHNLGSHVMFYIKQKLQSVSKIVDSKVLDNIIPGKIPDIAAVEAAIKANKDIELPFLVGLGRFINYLQERQDYIATIATDYIPANSTISFKDFVYDELKPDLRYERHYSKSNDAGWKPGNLLLDYIAYSEGYRSCDKIEILFGDFDGHKSSSDKDFQKLREFNIAVPGGVIGRQALFSIFENIIRNAAKHSERRSDNKLVLQLSLLEKDSELLKELKAKREKKKSEIDKDELKNLYSNHSDKYHFLRIKVDMPNPSGVIDTLVDNLADPYIDDNGAMKETTKGLKEMRISAAWLRGYSIDTEIPANDPPALSIYTEPYSKDNSKVTISYILCIPRPCQVAFIDSNNATDAQNKILAPYGCKVFPDPFKLKNEEDKEEYREKLIDEIANYEIVCMSEDNRDLCSRISSRYIANQDRSAELLEDLKGAITKDYEEKLKQEAKQAQIEAEKDPTEENKKKLKSANEKLSKIDEIKKGVIEDAIGSIYEEWFNTTNNGVTPKLVVADGKAVQNNKKESGSLSSDDNVILTNTGKITSVDDASNQNLENVNDVSRILSERIVTCDDVKEAVVYSTHFKGLASKSEGPDGYNTWLQNAICIESVTGNNSTARLIRQDKWSKEWKTKILSASMAKVAIFDERIFSSFISCESKAREDGLSVETIKQIKNDCQGDETRFQEALDNFAIPLHISETLFYANENDNTYAILEEFLAQYSHDVAQKNHERRIWAFDIRVPEDINNRVEIVGYNVLIGDRVGAYIEHKKDAIIEIANISRHSESGQYDIVLCKDQTVFEDGKTNIFDYISIHQGVLDKIYTAFGVKEVKMEKCKITNALHRCFSKHITPEDKEAFLPNFIIHSGRSKPSAADMPQHQPFVQFAAVDHAVKDCKYTLVELLATAHYEKDNNNN